MKKTILPIAALLLVLTLAFTACGGDEAPAEPPPTPAPSGNAAEGEPLFTQTCSACHGPKGEGVEGLGKDMTASEFIAGKSDDELVEFIKVGRAPDDPLNTTGVAMLPKGGNPSLSDEDLYNIVAHIRTLQK
jgi:disulfide bond formation protein DsbB